MADLEIAIEDVQTPRERRTFSMVQMVLMILTVGPMSGLGGAYTATATDDKQDKKIEAVQAEVVAVQKEVVALQGDIEALGDKVDAANEAAEKRADGFKQDVRGDIGALRVLIIDTIKAQARRGSGGP